jgi:hypothetical protein
MMKIWLTADFLICITPKKNQSQTEPTRLPDASEWVKTLTLIAAYQAKAERNRAVGKLGGRPKSNPEETQTVSKHNLNQEPITNNHKPIKERATSVACPPDVNEQVWQDWLHLRKSKKASVTETVVKGARSEAAKLGWGLESFLVEWCTRGSQGLKAEWITEKQTQNGLTKTGQRNATVLQGLTRGLLGGQSNVQLLK